MTNYPTTIGAFTTVASGLSGENGKTVKAGYKNMPNL